MQRRPSSPVWMPGAAPSEVALGIWESSATPKLDQAMEDAAPNTYKLTFTGDRVELHCMVRSPDTLLFAGSASDVYTELRRKERVARVGGLTTRAERFARLAFDLQQRHLTTKLAQRPLEQLLERHGFVLGLEVVAARGLVDDAETIEVGGKVLERREVEAGALGCTVVAFADPAVPFVREAVASAFVSSLTAKAIAAFGYGEVIQAEIITRAIGAATKGS